jgi:hypothetical protein
MRSFLFAMLFGVLCPLVVCSQEYGYTHYDGKEGLAGSTVYCMAKDKDGFLWFGTEGGLSRFDGTHFKNFTREDGLPDNEIVQIFADSKGRVWMAPFKKSICYYFKGKIYTPDNDPVLQRIRIDDFVVQFAEDKAGNMLLMEAKKLQLVDTSGRVTVIDSINGAPIIHVISGISAHADNGFMVLYEGSLFYYRNNRFQLRKTILSKGFHFDTFTMNSKLLVHRKDVEETEVVSFGQDKLVTVPFKKNHIRYCIIDDNLVGEGLQNGVIIYNINGTDSARYFFKDLPVNGILKDAESNIWFSTLGHGLYKLSSPFVLNVKLRKNNSPLQVLAFTRYKQTLLASTELNTLFHLNRITGRPNKESMLNDEVVYIQINHLNVYKERDIIGGSPSNLFKVGPDFKEQKSINPVAVKGMFPYNGKLFVATKENVLVIDPETFKIKDTIWHERATAVFVNNDTVYIGTVAGLYRRLPDKSMQFLGEKTPAFKSRITTFQKDSTGILWIGTYGDGLIGYKNNRIVASLNRRSGLTSNVCRTLYLQGNYLWIGTDKGISKINITRPDYPVTKYTTGDGLASDVINAIYVDSNKVFVGTPEGYTFFDEEKIINQSRCHLLFTDITMGGEHYLAENMPAVIAHKKNNVRFDYVGISYKSGGDVRYRYRLLGLDSTWQETRETFLSYPTLPSGDYELQVQAINKFDVHSQVIAAGFTIEKMLYEKMGFRVLIGLLFLAATGATVLLIVRRIRKREREKTDFIKRISELEQLSRKAQMNPHFIFNSLNSIQQYVMDADVAGANRFIAGFSRLIRQTLDFSSKPEISLEEELDYLTNYLEIEKTRLENAFSYSVAIDKGVDPADHYIPPMILQPFVENSVRHGLRFRKDKAGVVLIIVKREGDHLICILEDNGVGRKAAMHYKSISPINYQSKGLSLTADRIAMFNKEHEQKITMLIEDLEDELGNPLGTRVTISFPVF